MINYSNIEVVSRRKKRLTIERDFPDALILDVTSKAESPWIKFSPFYPHGGIPVPYAAEVFAESVEGVWQGLKVFDNHGVDQTKFNVTGMKGIKRTCRKYGNVLGHKKGVNSSELIPYIEARYEIYLPCYHFVLKNYLVNEIQFLRDKVNDGSKLVLLDYETNCDISDPSRPLSHAALIRSYISDNWPTKPTKKLSGTSIIR